MKYNRAKHDANHAEIAKAFRRMGYSVANTATVGYGFPDLVVAKQGVTTLIEIKTDKGQLSATQREFMARWKGAIAVIYSVDEAIKWARKDGVIE